MATLHAPDRRVSGSIPEWFRFGFVEPHSKNHSKTKRAKIPQFHSNYSKFRMYQGLNSATHSTLNSQVRTGHHEHSTLTTGTRRQFGGTWCLGAPGSVVPLGVHKCGAEGEPASCELQIEKTKALLRVEVCWCAGESAEGA